MNESQWIPHKTKSGKILYYINPASGECKWQSQLNKGGSPNIFELDVKKNTKPSSLLEPYHEPQNKLVPETQERSLLVKRSSYRMEEDRVSCSQATECEGSAVIHCVDNGVVIGDGTLLSSLQQATSSNSTVFDDTEIVNNLQERRNVLPTQQQGHHILQCPWCRIEFSCPNKLASHLRSHPEIDPLKCPVCSKEYASSTSLTTHLRIHTGEKPFTCSYCNKSFNQSSHLTTHMRIHTGEKPYKCPQCPKTFGQSSHLTLHVRIHNGEKPFLCGFCNKGFSHSSALSTHVRTHTGEKPFQCPQCPKRFGQSSHLRIHTRTHTGERPFQCHFCHKHFRQSCYLAKHLRSHKSKEKNETHGV
ncbi:uncharacterized protein LOC141897283 [Acropora palmata]|uniref:uncharacterized protein LOC141897283 n=1 Tax=Acropora palmata TaxID=6131 RepID=UPI003DA0494E